MLSLDSSEAHLKGTPLFTAVASPQLSTTRLLLMAVSLRSSSFFAVPAASQGAPSASVVPSALTL